MLVLAEEMIEDHGKRKIVNYKELEHATLRVRRIRAFFRI